MTTTETEYITASGRVFVISDGISNGAAWGTYERKANGSLRRICSPLLPLTIRKHALEDFKNYVAQKVYLQGPKVAREWAPIYHIWHPERKGDMV